jgi:uncharacterized protein Usg
VSQTITTATSLAVLATILRYHSDALQPRRMILQLYVWQTHPPIAALPQLQPFSALTPVSVLLQLIAVAHSTQTLLSTARLQTHA